MGPTGVCSPGAGWWRLDGGDVHLQHRHANQRAAVGARTRGGHAHAVRAGRLCAGLGVLGRVVRSRQSAVRPGRSGRVYGCRPPDGAPLPAAHGGGPGRDTGHALGRPVPELRARPGSRPRSGGAGLPRAPRQCGGLSGRDQPVARAAQARRGNLLAHLPRPGRPVTLCGALHRHLVGRLPAPTRPRHAGRP